jgi:hypothetical protein
MIESFGMISGTIQGVVICCVVYRGDLSGELGCELTGFDEGRKM